MVGFQRWSQWCGVICGLTLFVAGGCSDDDPSDDSPVNSVVATPVDADNRCDAINASIVDAGFSDGVSIRCDSEHAYLGSTMYPDHDLMNGIVVTNEQLPVPATGYKAPIPLNPKMAKARTTIDNAVGIAVNGIPIYDYSSQGELDVDSYDPNVDTVLLEQLDNCGGHAGRGDDYHYHKAPNCMMEAMVNQGDDAIIGWGFDGYPIYGFRTPSGEAISNGALDSCNGMADATFGYRYHVSAEPPYIVQCLVGEVDLQILQRVSPMQGRPTGTPPQGGVENLVYEELSDDTRRMSYYYQGDEYYTSYKPSSNPNCYDFELKMVTTGGKVQREEFCR